MGGRLSAKQSLVRAKDPATRRDRLDAARLKRAGDPAHINPAEDRLLRRELPESHGAVVTRGLLAEAGRLGDDRVTQINTREAALLRARGGSGTRNPMTGLLEYWDSDGGMSGGVGDDSGGTSQGGGHSDSDSFGGGDGGGGGLFSGRLESRAYDPMSMPAVESLLAAPDFSMPGVSFEQYAPRDTWARAWQEYMTPHPAAVRATPGRFGAPNAYGPGIMGSMVAQLAGGPMSTAMGIGAAMGRASSAATQAASARDEAARSGHNSGGNQGSHSVLDMDAARAGMQSGAQTADLPQAPPGYTVNPAGQIVPIGGNGRDRPAWKDPVENLLYDYIWRGRTGAGPFSW
jgi:hypothetical protein